jgi:hypothetical protein
MVYFQTKIPILVNFGGSCNGKCWHILWPIGKFSGHLPVYFHRFLLYRITKNLATLMLLTANQTKKTS